MLLFDLSHCCNSICNLCHQISYRHRLPSPYRAYMQVCIRAHICTHTHVTFRKKQLWKEHTESDVVACAGRELAVFLGWKNENATVLIVMMMPAGGLELKQLFAYKMVLVSRRHINHNRVWERVLKSLGATYSFKEHFCDVLFHLLGRWWGSVHLTTWVYF